MKQLIELSNKNYDLESEIKTQRYESEKNLQSLSKLNDILMLDSMTQDKARHVVSNDEGAMEWSALNVAYGVLWAKQGGFSQGKKRLYKGC